MIRWQSRLVLAALFLAATMPLQAQTYHGGIRGAVREQGGVVPDVTLSLVNDATGNTRSTRTNQVGEYAFVNVEPGTYTLVAERQSFRKIERKSLRIGTQQFLTLDLTLEIGNLQEIVTVMGASALETSNASVGSTLDTATLQTLPTAGRNPFFLAVTTPGVVPSGDPQFVRQQDQTNSSLLSLGGGPRRANNYTLDGVSIVDLRNRATFIPSIEATEEVKVQVSTYDAEMGRTGGGVFNTTGKSGANDWHGSVLYQNRPEWGKGKFFFSRDQPKPEGYFHLYGGSFGGPLVRDKTFFWASAEGYKTKTSRSAVVTAPSQAELNGNFSASGVTIYDPLTTVRNPDGTVTRQPFPNNVIPANRISPVAQAMRQYWPTAGPSTAELVDKAIQGTMKLDHRWSDKAHSSIMYAFYDSEEPESRFYAKELGSNPGEPAEGLLFRFVNVLAFNNTFTPNPNTFAHVRLGWTTFRDDDVPNQFDPATLGFSQPFVNQLTYKKFPSINIPPYGTVNFDTFGDRDPQDTDYYSWDANASMSKLYGRHTLKFGASYRKIGMKLFARGQPSGNFDFDSTFTRGPNPLTASGASQHALAAFLLGFPTTGDMTVATENDFSIDYYAGYVQDDFRVNSKLTVNLGLRYEFEQGLKEKNNAFTVGFDRERSWPFQVPGAPPLRGGLQYPGVDGYPDHQSDPSKTKFAPRVGFAWSANPSTVVRGGYGLFWAPQQYAFPNQFRMGARGYTASTDYVASIDGNLTPCATCNIVNPFPAGINQPRGSADGILTGAGGTVDFVDQFRESAYVHQFSLDIQRELPGELVVGLGYVGARTERISVGGSNSNTVNINQLDPRHLSLGAALLDPLPNPFFGDPRFGAFARRTTLTRGQLLRPYPQFGDIRAHQVSDGKARYHSVVLRFERRIKDGWGARVNYTWSSNKDNLFGEVNYFSNNSGGRARALNVYDIENEYSDSLLHTPHRLNVTGTVELPLGKGKRWLSEPGLARVLFGGWSITVIGAYQSGFPVAIVQNTNNTNAFTDIQRPNVTGTDPRTSGGTEERLNNWFNTAAWTNAAPFTLGNSPRTDTRARTPFKSNTDIAFQKVEPLGGNKQLMVRLELINAFDDANFLAPENRFGNSNFGRITQVGGFPRTVQLMVRFGF